MSKEYHKQKADDQRGAKYHHLEEGDVVLMRNLKKGTLQPNFKDEEYDVIDVNGGEVAVKSKDTGKIYKRNSSHLKVLQSSRNEMEKVSWLLCQ